MPLKTLRERMQEGIELPAYGPPPVANAYFPLGLPETQGNLCIEVIGNLILEVSDFEAECLRKLPRGPLGLSSVRSNPVLASVSSYHALNTLVYPTPYLLTLYERLLTVITAGYLYRNPLVPRTNNTLIHMLSSSEPEDIRQRVEGTMDAAPVSLLVTGASGMGKTYGIKFLLGHLKQAWTHERNGRRIIQVVWLYVQCPPTGTLKALLMSILLALDMLLGTRYARTWLDSRVSVDILLMHVVLILVTHNVGVLVLDELQHLRARGFAESETSLNFFVALMNYARIPIVSIGTYASLELLAGALREARRLCGMGSVEFARYTAGSVLARAVQDYFLKLVPGIPAELLTVQFHQKFSDAYQGLQFLLPNFVHRVSGLIPFQRIEKLDAQTLEGLLAHWRYVELKPIAAVLDALATGQPEKIAQVQDVFTRHSIAALNSYQDQRAPSAKEAALRAAAPGASSRPGEFDPEFPHSHLTAEQILHQCKMTRYLFGDGDYYPAMKANDLIATGLRDGLFDLASSQQVAV